MAAQPPGNSPFAPRPTRAKANERAAFWVFRMATYFVLLCAVFIFGIIALRGGAVVFSAFKLTDSFPYFSNSFLAESPQTLNVILYREIPADAPKGAPVVQLLEKLKDDFKDVEPVRLIAVNPRDNRFAFREESGQLVLARSAAAIDRAAVTLNVGVTYENTRGLAQNFALPPLTIKFVEPGTPVEDEVSKLQLGERNYRAWAKARDFAAPLSESYSYSGGGIFQPIAGTVLLVVGAMAIALFFGVLCAVYLSEYARSGRTLRIIRLSVRNLAGVPSIVFGIFGFGLFVLFMGWGVSLAAGWFTLAFMALPIVISASEESLRAIPVGFREASLALGATKWQTVRKSVLPYALPGILTSSILGLTRVAGETAPILFTAAVAQRSELPWEPTWLSALGNAVMALPYHIYVVAGKIPSNEYTAAMQYGSSFVFLVIIGAFALTSVLLRVRVRRLYKW